MPPSRMTGCASVAWTGSSTRDASEPKPRSTRTRSTVPAGIVMARSIRADSRAPACSGGTDVAARARAAAAILVYDRARVVVMTTSGNRWGKLRAPSHDHLQDRKPLTSLVLLAVFHSGAAAKREQLRRYLHTSCARGRTASVLASVR